MQSWCVFLVLGVAAVRAGVVDINNATDIALAKANEYLRQKGITYSHIPHATFSHNVSVSDSLIIGVDSLVRTDDNTITFENSSYSFNFHYGWSLYQQSFKFLNINGEVFSGGFRVKDNSVHFAFTIHNDTACYVTLEDLRIERLAKVDFFASRPEFDGIDIDDVFEEYVLPYWNKKIDRSEVQQGLQAICKYHPRDFEEHMPLVHLIVTKAVTNVY